MLKVAYEEVNLQDLNFNLKMTWDQDMLTKSGPLKLTMSN